MSGVLEMQKIHLSYNILLPLQADSLLPLPLPQSLYGQCSVVYADVITKFSQMDRLPNFLNYGAPLVRRSTIKFCGYWSEIFSTSKQRRAISNHPHFQV